MGELEEELVQQRHTQQELSAVAESVRGLQRQEARLEADVWVASTFHGPSSRATNGGHRYGAATVNGVRSSSRCSSPAPTTSVGRPHAFLSDVQETAAHIRRRPRDRATRLLV